MKGKRILADCLFDLGLADRRDHEYPAVDDWDRALPELKRHALIPLAAGCLLEDGSGAGLPDGVSKILEHEQQRYRMQHKLALVMLGRLDDLCRKENLSCAVLKGPHLYDWLYRDLFPRPYDDIDFLVRRKDIGRIVRLLDGLGYRPAGGRISQKFMRRGHFHIVLEHIQKTLLRIELHWELVDRANLYRLDMAGIFDRLETYQAQRVRFGVLSGEDNFIYLCLHTAKHGIFNSLGLNEGYHPQWFCHTNADNRLIWFIDILLFLEREMGNLEWPAISAMAERQNIRKDLAVCLSLLGLLFPRSGAGEALGRLGLRMIEARPDRSGMAAGILRTRWGRRMVRRSMNMSEDFFFRPARLFPFLKVLFPPPAEMKGYYGLESPRLLPLLYFSHPFRMILRQVNPR